MLSGGICTICSTSMSLSFLIYKMGLWREGLLASAIPAGSARRRSASAQKSAISRSSPGERVPTFLEYSERRWPPGAQEPERLERMRSVPADATRSAPRRRRREGGDSGARPRPPVLARGRARLGNPRGAESIFTRARLKIVAALGAEPEIAVPR